MYDTLQESTPDLQKITPQCTNYQHGIPSFGLNIQVSEVKLSQSKGSFSQSLPNVRSTDIILQDFTADLQKFTQIYLPYL